MDEDVSQSCNKQRARVLVKFDGRKVPSSLQGVVGLVCFVV